MRNQVKNKFNKFTKKNLTSAFIIGFLALLMMNSCHEYPY